VVYVDKASVEQEIAPARTAYAGGSSLMREVFATVKAGRALDAERVKAAVTTMAESVLRNPDALLLYSQLREKDDYTVAHSLDVCLYMIAFGRFLQLEPGQIEFLGYLGLLQDIGKVRLPGELLEKPGRLSVAEFERAKLHVSYSVEILRATPGLPRDLPRLAALHHERHDGSGYPRNLRAPEIGMIGSIAAIADTFDALTLRRPYAEPVAPSAALNMLYKWRGVFFDAQLVEQFIRCIGIFPVGSLVELNSGEVGVVIAQNQVKRLQPRVMVIRDAAGNPLRPHKLLDLSREPKVSADEAYRIRRTLEYGRIPVKAEELFMQ
jgi:HD-GYP domain-containing protein (c-di-GMP phosphodiesterase class II)